MNDSRNPRVLAVMALTLLLAACGSPAAPVAHAPAGTTASPSPGVGAGSTATPTAAPAVTAAPTPIPAPAPPALIAETQVPSSTMTIRLLGLDGSTVASTSIPNGSVDGWVKAGPDGAYWLSGGILHRLGRNGGVTDVATIPKGSLFAVGPDGRIAYSDMIVPSAGGSIWTNRLSVIIDGTTQVLADRPGTGSASAAAAAASGIPQYDWYYDPVTWTDAGIVIARLPQGGCGCGSFGMDSVQGYTAVVDPTTGVAASVMDDTTCPLSGIAADGLTACFHTPEVRTSKNEGLGADSIRLLGAGAVAQTFSLSTQNAGGDAVFSPDATQVAYATSPAGLDCGTWQGKTQMRVLNPVSGAAQAIGPAGLQPIGWLPDGRIVASDTTGPVQTLQTGVAIVDPASGAVTPVPSTTTTSTRVLGVVTG